MYNSCAASVASLSYLYLGLTHIHIPAILNVARQVRLWDRLKIRMSPSNAVTVSEFRLGIVFSYNNISHHKYALT